MTTQMLGLVSSLVLTFGIAWGLCARITRRGLSPNSRAFQLAILPGAFAPAIASIIVRAFITKEGLPLAIPLPGDRNRHVIDYGRVVAAVVRGIVCGSCYSLEAFDDRIRKIHSPGAGKEGYVRHRENHD